MRTAIIICAILISMPAKAMECFSTDEFMPKIMAQGFSLLGAGPMPGGHKEGQLWVDRNFNWIISRAGDDGQTCVMWGGKNWEWAPRSKAHDHPA